MTTYILRPQVNKTPQTHFKVNYYKTEILLCIRNMASGNTVNIQFQYAVVSKDLIMCTNINFRYNYRERDSRLYTVHILFIMRVFIKVTMNTLLHLVLDHVCTLPANCKAIGQAFYFPNY